jgi:hypothetical protein
VAGASSRAIRTAWPISASPRLRDSDRVLFESLERAVGQDDPGARDLGQRVAVDADRVLLVNLEREDLPPEDVVFVHCRAQLASGRRQPRPPLSACCRTRAGCMRTGGDVGHRDRRGAHVSLREADHLGVRQHRIEGELQVGAFGDGELGRRRREVLRFRSEVVAHTPGDLGLRPLRSGGHGPHEVLAHLKGNGISATQRTIC